MKCNEEPEGYCVIAQDVNNWRTGRRRMRLSAGDKGFTLVELLIATSIGLFLLSAAYSIFVLQNKTLNAQEQIVGMQRNVRAVMDMITRETRMAGYDPAGVNADLDASNDFSGITASSSQLEIKADLDGNAIVSADERIIYAYDSGNMHITRDVGDGNQILAEEIEAFDFEYMDSAGNTTTADAEVRKIRITIRGRTSMPDPGYGDNGGYRSYELVSDVQLRNLSL
jgi:prepilin-type N-terminal cleavage/methylation domain-containing protein